MEFYRDIFDVPQIFDNDKLRETSVKLKSTLNWLLYSKGLKNKCKIFHYFPVFFSQFFFHEKEK